MEVFFKNAKVRKQCCDPAREFRWNDELIFWITTRMHQFMAASTLLDIKRIRDANFHPLNWSRAYEIAVDALVWWKRWKQRIIFTPKNNDEIFNDMYNDSKIQRITEIEILEINEKHYEK